MGAPVSAPTVGDEERAHVAALQMSDKDVMLNIRSNMSQENVELCQQGIDVDNDKNPSPENPLPSVPAPFTVCEWVKYTNSVPQKS